MKTKIDPTHIQRDMETLGKQVFEMMTSRLTRQEAIEAKCRECSYDELDAGTWRQQIGRCEITNYPLWVYRPMPYPKRSSCNQAVQPENGG